MSTRTATYHYSVCSGKLDNLVVPNCPAVSSGVLGEKEDADLLAKQEGWTKDGTKDYCMGCSAKRAPEAVAVAKVRKARVQNSAPVDANEHHE